MRKQDIQAAFDNNVEVYVKDGWREGWGMVSDHDNGSWLVTFDALLKNSWGEPTGDTTREQGWFKPRQIVKDLSQELAEEAERAEEAKRAEAREQAKEAERAARVAAVPEKLTEWVQRYSEQAAKRVDEYRDNITIAVANFARPEQLADAVNDLATATAEETVYKQVLKALTRQGLAAADEYLFETLINDTGIRYLNCVDVQRAHAEGVRRAAENVRSEIAYWVAIKAGE